MVMFNTWSADKRATFIIAYGVFDDVGLPIASEEEFEKNPNHFAVSIMDEPVSLSTILSSLFIKLTCIKFDQRTLEEHRIMPF